MILAYYMYLNDEKHALIGIHLHILFSMSYSNPSPVTLRKSEPSGTLTPVQEQRKKARTAAERPPASFMKHFLLSPALKITKGHRLTLGKVWK